MDNIRVAIILPTTLKYANYDDLKKISCFENIKNIKYGIFMAVDEDDDYDIKKLKNIFQKSDNIIIKKFPINKPPKICNMWKSMAQLAYDIKYDLFLLLGDDIEIYKQVHIEWRENILSESINIIKKKYKNLKPIITIDVVVPCYRINKFYIEKILEISSDERTDHRFIIIIDKNIEDINKNTYNYLKECEEKYNVRIRVNEKNMGASYSRNKGLKESHSDWILYLDDDVIPDKNIIIKYVDSLIENPQKDGFVGNSILEKNKYHSTDSVHMAQTTFFWNISENFKYVSWGVTANLFVKRYNNIEFDLDFPKTGGGEDIDFCLKLKNWPLVSVKDAIVVHPWWNDGKRIYMWKRFIKWALGDGLLINKYPNFTYRTLPNIWEWSLLFALISVVVKNIFDKIIILWIAEFVSGTLWIYFKKENCTHLKGLRRLTISLESNIVRNSSELGHIIRHVKDFKYLNLTKRFDWFCGLYPEGIEYEKVRSLFHNFMFLIFIVLYQNLQK